MNVLVTGGTGFVGGALVDMLALRNERVTIVTRDPERARAARAGVTYERWLPDVSRFDAVVHLMGEPVIGKRWTAAQKHVLRASRIDTTRALVASMERATPRPAVFVCGSAIGYYGDRGDELLPESAAPGSGFLAELCVEWEQAAVAAEAFGVRVVRVRTSIVLGRSGGALARMLPLFRLGLGGPLGSGRAWFPWIHVRDQCRLVLHALDRADVRGALNAAAPQLVRNKEFARALGRVLARPAILPAPAFALELALGESASALTGSQRCVPELVLQSGFVFEFSALEPALRDVTRRS